jgi:hypothetical protein
MPKRPLVVSFANSDYLGVLANWLIGFRRLGLPLPRIYCLDERTQRWARRWGCSTRLLEWDGDLASLWKTRISVFAELADNGTDFIHSDLDAVWLRDPLADPDLVAKGADMVFSQGTVWPRDVFENQGFVLCCGWFRMRPSEGVKGFLQALAEHVAETGDDQISVNRLLADTAWNLDGIRPYRLAHKADLFTAWQGLARGRHEGFGLDIALAPHGRIPRVADSWPDPAIRHILTPKTAESKLAALEAEGLLMLRRAEAPGEWAPLEDLDAEPASA